MAFDKGISSLAYIIFFFFLSFSFLFFFFFLVFLGPHLLHLVVPKLGVELGLLQSHSNEGFKPGL